MTTPALQPTWVGHVATTKDALKLFEGCLNGVLNHVPRRPHDRERPQLIKSGSVFIYEENASGIKRWTDGVPWSPSRILGNFLVYRELTKPFPPGEKKRATKRSKRVQRAGEPYPRPDGTPVSPTTPGARSDNGLDREGERALIGSLVDSYGFKEGGLVKKTMSVQVHGIHHHLVSYYNIEDVLSGNLRTPKEDPHVNSIIPRGELMTRQNFRTSIEGEEDPNQQQNQGNSQQMLYGGYDNQYDPRRAYENGAPHGHQSMNMTLFGGEQHAYTTSSQMQNSSNSYAPVPQASHGYYQLTSPVQHPTMPAYSQAPYASQNPTQGLMPHDRPSAHSQQTENYSYGRTYEAPGIAAPRVNPMINTNSLQGHNYGDSSWPRRDGITAVPATPLTQYTMAPNGSTMTSERTPANVWNGTPQGWAQHVQAQSMQPLQSLQSLQLSQPSQQRHPSYNNQDEEEDYRPTSNSKI
ncbi:hypothetical protein MMC30_009230 [Trapelia coarctata]|nr:hypothetical protein [Trapelia coarctata]